jgi:outer membrane protein assembly factor BamB
VAAPLFELTQPASVNNFPTSLAVSGNLAVIGGDGPYISFSQRGPGAAFVYDLTTGQRVSTLAAATAVRPSSNFGDAVAIDGNLALVGSPTENRFGAAYLFDAITGQQLFRLAAQVPETDGHFGKSVAIANGLAVVGSVNGDAEGQVTVFDAATGTYLRTLLPADHPLEASFGFSVATSGNYAIVGAPYDEHSGPTSGSAYVFDLTTGAQVHKLVASDAHSEAYFGSDVAIDGTRLAVSASKQDGFQKEAGVYVFDLVTGAQTLHIEDTQSPRVETGGTYYRRFGTTVSLVGDRLLIGAPDNSEQVESAGAAFLYDVNTGALLSKYSEPTPGSFNWFGYSLAMTDSKILIDTSREGESGSAFVFAMVPEPSSIGLAILSWGAIALRHGKRTRFVAP